MNPLCRRSPFLEARRFDLEPYRWVMCFWPYLTCSDDSLSCFQIAFFWSKDDPPSNFEGCCSTVVRETGSLSLLCICDAPQSICAPVSKFGDFTLFGVCLHLEFLQSFLHGFEHSGTAWLWMPSLSHCSMCDIVLPLGEFGTFGTF